MRLKSLFFIATFAIIFCSSCSKIEESRLVGEWRVVDVGISSWPDETIWKFYSGDKLEITDDVNGKIDSTITCTWEVHKSKWRKYVRIKTDYGYIQGDWRVDKHTHDQLILTRESFLDGSKDGAFLRREFEKK